MDVNLVFEGGGVTGISHVGAVKALEERGFKIKRCAGSIIAALVMAGYTAKELIDLLQKTDFKLFMKKTNLGKLPYVGKPLSIIFNKGLYDSQGIEDWISELLEKKGKTKFKHFMEGNAGRLKIVAADITTRRMLIFPDDLKRYNINPSEFSVAKAVRMSCAIPFYFTPYTLRYNDTMSFIVDGGLLSSFPIWIFDMEDSYNCPTLGIKIKDRESYSSQGKTGIISYIRDVVDAPLNVDEDNFIRRKDFVRTIILNYDGIIKATSFDKANKASENLYKSGYKSTIDFVSSWNFNRYREYNFVVS